MKNISSDIMENAVINARLKATKIAAMAWADAKVCRETLDIMQKHGIRPMLEAMQRCADLLSNIQHALGALRAVETVSPRLDAALNALDNLINDRIAVITKKNKETDHD